MLKKILIGLVAGLLCLPVSVMAADAYTRATFGNRKATMTVTYEDSGDPVSNAEFTFYQIGEFVQTSEAAASAGSEIETLYRSIIPSITFTGDATQSVRLVQDTDEAEEYADLVTAYYMGTNVSGAVYAGITDVNGKIMITEAEPGIYLVKETKAADGYAASVPFILTSPMVKDGAWEFDVSAEPKPNPLGSLVIEKTVTGSAGETDRSFKFKVTFTSDTKDESSAQFTIVGSDGVEHVYPNGSEFSLKNGESVKITNIPAGENYSVVETEANTDGYTTTATNEIGTIVKLREQVASFTNHRDTTSSSSSNNNTSNTTGDNAKSLTVTKTGDTSPIAIYLNVMMMALGVLVLVSARKKNR